MRNAFKASKIISVEEFDARFDAGEDMSDYIDWDSAVVGGPVLGDVVSIMFPAAFFDRIETEAARRGTSVQTLMEVWIEDGLARSAS